MNAVTLLVVVALLALPSDRQRQNHQGEVEDRVYHQVKLQDLAKTSWTHVEVEATLAQAHKEDDGDVHLDLVDGTADGVAEIIPLIPLPVPKTGTRVRVRGIARVDRRHGWGEVHPVEALEVVR